MGFSAASSVAFTYKSETLAGKGQRWGKNLGAGKKSQRLLVWCAI
jgi:hypothetical protein